MRADHEDETVGAAVSLPLVGEEWELLDRLVATVVQVDALANAVSAWRTELVDAVRRLGEQVHTHRFGEAVPGMARRSTVAELATALRIPERTMAAQVDAAQALVEHHPAALAGMCTGAISYRHAEVLMEHTADLDRPAREAAETALLELAARQTVSRFRASARRWRDGHHPRAVEDRHRAAAEKRGVWVDPSLDGMAYLSALLPAVQAYAIHDGVTGLASGLQGPDEVRTLDQLRADVLSALLLDPAGAALARAVRGDGAVAPCSLTSSTTVTPSTTVASSSSAAVVEDDTLAAAGDATVREADATPLAASLGERCGVPAWVVERGIRAQISVTVPFLTLLGRSDEPGHLAGYGPLDAGTVRTLAAEASGWTRILTDPVTGDALDIGRTRYRVPGSMRRYLRQRDGTCRFPGCMRAAARCDVDHTVAWEDGGGTSVANLAHLCRAHHRLKHLAGWDVEQSTGGVLRWRSPVGRTYVTEPAIPVAPLRRGSREPGRRTVPTGVRRDEPRRGTPGEPSSAGRSRDPVPARQPA